MPSSRLHNPLSICWGVRKSEGISEHNVPWEANESKTKRGQRIPDVLASKVVNPFTRALRPPFIGRRRDFYIPRSPSNLENIPSVNTYMNVFYIPWFAELISHIYKPATCTHFKLGLFEMTSLTWSLADPQSLIHEDLRSSGPTNQDSLSFPKFTGPCASRSLQVHTFLNSPDSCYPETDSRLTV
jgi:hypothetical protein